MPGYELIGKEERDAVIEVFDKGGVLSRFGLDERRQNIFRVREFEIAFAKKMGATYAHAVSSGTAALKVALRALDVKRGDEVITQCHTFVATVEAIMDLGAKPVITEVNRTLNMDPDDLEKKITQKTRVIIPVHMLGAPAQMDEILSISKSYDIPLLEDAAQALGGEYKGKKLGTIGDAGTFSFDLGKILTTGEGGMVITNNRDIFSKAKAYADHGHENNPQLTRAKDSRKIWGFNYRMTELQGAIGLVQLKKLDFALKRQKENYKMIKNGIENRSDIEFPELADPEGITGDTIVFFLKNKEKAAKFAERLEKGGFETKNIPSAISWHFAGLWDHMLPEYEEYKDLKKLWRSSANLLTRAIAIPVNIFMDENQVEKLVSTINKILTEIN